MKIVLYNDLLNLKKTLARLVLFIFVFAGIQILMLDNLGMGLVFPFLILAMTSLNVFYFSDVAKSDLYIMALGARKKDFVVARYILSAIFLLLAIILSFFIFILAFYKGILGGGEYIFAIAMIGGFCFVWMGMALPIYFKYDFSKARSVVIFLYLTIFFISFFTFSRIDFKGDLVGFINKDPALMGAMVFIFGLVFYFLSYILSKRIIKKKY